MRRVQTLKNYLQIQKAKLMKYFLPNRILNALNIFFLREISFIGKQRLITFIVYVTVLTIGLTCNIVGVSGVRDHTFKCINIIYLAMVELFFVLYVLRVLKLKTCLYILTNISHVTLSLEVLLFAYIGTHYSMMLAIATFVLLAVNIIYSLSSYLKYNSYILSATTIIVCCICVFQFHSRALYSFFTLFITSFVMLSILGERLVANTSLLESENRKYKKDEEDFLMLFRMKREPIKAYIQLAQSKVSAERTHELFSQMKPYQISNVIYNVMTYMSDRDVNLEDLKEALPELTLSEIKICRLVLQGKKQGEICGLLCKSKSNVNTQRAHIRKKLSIPTEKNLKVALQRIINNRKK